MNAKIASALFDALREEMTAKPEPVTRVESIGAWCKAGIAKKYFGVSIDHLKRWVVNGDVIAKKLADGGAVVYRTADIERAIEALPNYKFSATAAE